MTITMTKRWDFTLALNRAQEGRGYNKITAVSKLVFYAQSTGTVISGR